MFGSSRRHRQQASQPLTSATANPNAATAAASAFARRASSPSLSSAAAAAALRARPTTPINVSEVQTKRTQKRSASVSSQRSQDTQRSLHRSPSQGSMTERSFRSPSPSPHRAPAVPEDAPPVPTIPDNMRSNGGTTPHKRATSLQMQPFRVASQKTKEGGSWFGAATEGNMANVRTSDVPMRVASPESRPGAVSPTSSVNYSYPRGLHGASPPASPTVKNMSMTISQRLASPRRSESVNSRSTTSEQTLVYDPNSRRMVPKVDPIKQQSVRDASEKSPKKKKQQQGLARSGSHLAKGTMGRVQGAAVDTNDSAQKHQQQHQGQAPANAPEQKTLRTQSPAKTPQPARVASPVEESIPTTQVQPPAPVSTLEQRTYQPARTSPESNRPVRSPEPEPPIVEEARKSDDATLPSSEARKGVPVLTRKPSTVREESDEDLDSSEDEGAQEPAAQQDVANVLDAIPVRSSAPTKQPSLSTESTVIESQVSSSQRQPSPPAQRQHETVRIVRAHSSSPARSARFALGADQLAVRHEPPPRSVSPRKSALKHSTSPSRGASPTEESSEASGPSRYGSEVTAVEAPVGRKKSVRVSFDDENSKVVGQSAAKPDLDSPVPPSPQQTKRHWYSHLGRNRKKDILLDDDEVMKPRPALPSFGSVRDKKPRESEERPLVRPIEPPSSPSVHDTSTNLASSDTEESRVPVGQSNDHNVGAILNQDQTARNAANISRFREPLPPVVTSMEGSGYYSLSSSSSEDEEEHEIVQEPEPTLPPEQVKEEILATHPEIDDESSVTAADSAPIHKDETGSRQVDEDVPSISVTQPTPTPRDTRASGSSKYYDAGYFDVPGGFPEDESDDNMPHSHVEPEVSEVTKVQHEQAPAPKTERSIAFAPSTQKTTYKPIVEETESSEGDSIYSDAYEDLSEADGDGFMSLDAVITAPIPEQVSQKLYEKVLAPPQEISKDSATSQYQSGRTSPPIPNPHLPEDEWEKAKLYWRGLTSDKRKQLEQEVLEEAGADGDLEEAVQPKKLKRKKSVRRDEPTEQPQATPEPDRVYQIQPGTKAADEPDESPSTMRKTLRGPQPLNQESSGKLQKTMRGAQANGGSGMRKTLRSETPAPNQSMSQPQLGGSGGMRKSMRQNGSSQAGGPQQRVNAPVGNRPLSLQGPPSTREAQERRSKHNSVDASMTSTEMAKALQANLSRRNSDSSETSFRRTRPRREGFGFRKSMRAGAAPEPSAAGRNSRFSLRSPSPPGSPMSPPVAMGTRMTMRTMRRDSSDSSTRRMRLPSFGKSSTKKTSKPGNKSRFGDSSDEEDAKPTGFRSRFADSSDEEDAPVREPTTQSAPKTRRASSSAAAAAMNMPPPRYDEKGEESPDLPDSSDDEAGPPPPVLQKPSSPRKVSGGRLIKSQSDCHELQRSGSGRGAVLESSMTPAMGTQIMSRPSQQRRGSFLSVLRRKKDNDMGKISRPSQTESAARMDTKLERSPDEVAALRSNTISPRLKQQMENWPLVEETIDDEKRPTTSDGSNRMDASRPSFVQRRSTNQVLTSGRHGSLDSTQLDATGKKKKKFGTLRRMFKLHD
ncbi:hypothetical protein CkaCkLH20_02980 [Colletotrichum karsti]|uniref:Uncharacterized protein n=1 Tax=Colletotrichum karsti TaxID=1095194 RepID=A0A9P6LPB1_9PEZI|nr:uncharacterized protein CkaCkLH20_02980 [Colletotrichum karsti]KAF9879437.1 hypothetical protein CkaCkLH20_02980 [Colletotrichum karsti]